MTALRNAQELFETAGQMISPTTYCVRLAADGTDLRAAQALRFAVFNLDLDEGLAVTHGPWPDAL